MTEPERSWDFSILATNMDNPELVTGVSDEVLELCSLYLTPLDRIRTGWSPKN